MAKALMRNIKSKGMQVSKKAYFTSFPFQLQCLNFNANMGTSLTKSQLLTQMPKRRKNTE